VVSSALIAGLSTSANAQSVAGGTAGVVWSRQLEDRQDPSESRKGAILGAFLDVQTPVRHLAILAEAFYAQRGGLLDPVGTSTEPAEIRVDMLDFTVAPTVRFGFGPASAFAYGGPTLEITMNQRYSPEIAAAYQTPAGQLFAVTAGAGVAFGTGLWSVRAEARIVEELSPAFTGDAGDLKYRSQEILVRVGRLIRP